jgi:cyclopropane-fatty-acyl-phospholipid synthase
VPGTPPSTSDLPAGAAPTTEFGASPDAIQFHYDVGTDFYQLWLDPSLTYSCAMWDGVDGDESETPVLAAAQRAKILYHLDQAKVAEGGRLLDVGCGWGGLLAVATAERQAARAVGLTLSRDQATHIAGLGLQRTEVRLESWRDHQPTDGYDAIVSIGAFEHFAQRGLSPAARIGAYADFFARCFEWLPERGRLSLQTIGLDDEVENDGPIAGFYASDVFPDSTPPRLVEILMASDRYFSVSALRNDGDDYARTLHGWTERLQGRRAEAEALVGGDTYRTYIRYLRVSRAMFRRRTCTLYRITMERRPRPLPAG